MCTDTAQCCPTRKPHNHLWQLLGDPAEYVVVELPGLSEVLHVAGSLVLLAPLVSFREVATVRLEGGDRKGQSRTTYIALSRDCFYTAPVNPLPFYADLRD